MCGIFGAFQLSGAPLATEGKFSHQAFLSATEMATHRGPDNIGHFSHNDCFLGHTRLSILGLGRTGHQPFTFNELVLTFNGEIFNYIELKEELRGAGYTFTTQTDTEVVLKAFAHWGPECFARFNGMWALAIYDTKTQSLTISRDRFGQKPLFVLAAKDLLLFASEFQQLTPFSDGHVDYGLIGEFLREGGYASEGRTFLGDIEEFPKAHYAEVSTGGSLAPARFWDYPDGPITETNAESFKTFDELLEDAVRIRLRSDVQMSIMLSGGVDSTLIAALARSNLPENAPFPGFTYSSKDSQDETHYSQRVADKLSIDLTTKEQTNEPLEYTERLAQLVRHLGRGHSSPAIVSIDYLYESVNAAGIRVALDGQGADELLGGYKTYAPLAIGMFLRSGEFNQAFLYLKDLLRDRFTITLLLFLRRLLPASGRKIGRWLYGYERLFRSFKGRARTTILEKTPSQSRNKNAFNRFLIWYHSTGLENLLYYGDIVAMKNSVENRSPFMDYRLIDFAYSQSERLKLWNGLDKYALRRHPLYDRFRSELDRKKVGFASSIKPQTKLQMISELKTSPILDWPIFSKKMRKHLEQGLFENEKYERLLFRMYQVHLWERIFCRKAANSSKECPTAPLASVG